MITLFILIYLVSLAIHLIMCYREDRRIIYKVGDLIDEIEFYMWCPILNTSMIILLILFRSVEKIWEFSKWNILWQKFRNIKLK